MTDPDLLAPTAGRPPVSVWLAVCWAALPATLLYAVKDVNSVPSTPGTAAVGAVGWVATAGLICGRRWGLLVGWLVAAVYAGHAVMWWYEWRAGRFGGPVPWLMLVPSICLGFSLAFSLWWPETRRWCGLLPADPYGEADDD